MQRLRKQRRLWKWRKSRIRSPRFIFFEAIFPVLDILKFLYLLSFLRLLFPVGVPFTIGSRRRSRFSSWCSPSRLLCQRKTTLRPANLRRQQGQRTVLPRYRTTFPEYGCSTR